MYQKGGGGQETRQKSGNLPPKAGELASLPLYHATCQKIFESQLLMTSLSDYWPFSSIHPQMVCAVLKTVRTSSGHDIFPDRTSSSHI